MNYKIQTISQQTLNKKLHDEVIELTQPINDTYAAHTQWLTEKFIPGLKDGSRKMVIARDENENLAGVALLKDTEEEKKLCCLYVRKDCRGFGIAGKLIQTSLTALKTDMPFLSISEANLPQLQKLLNIHRFKFSYRKKGAYDKNNTEYYFNNPATEDLKNKILTPLFARAQKAL